MNRFHTLDEATHHAKAEAEDTLESRRVADALAIESLRIGLHWRCASERATVGADDVARRRRRRRRATASSAGRARPHHRVPSLGRGAVRVGATVEEQRHRAHVRALGYRHQRRGHSRRRRSRRPARRAASARGPRPRLPREHLEERQIERRALDACACRDQRRCELRVAAGGGAGSSGVWPSLSREMLHARARTEE